MELRTDEHGRLVVPDEYRSAWDEYIDPDAPNKLEDDPNDVDAADEE